MGDVVSTDRKMRWVLASELCILLMNVLEACRRGDVGFEHADLLLDQFFRQIDRPVKISEEDLQSALWSANLLNERGSFWHPWHQPFEDFIKKLLKNASFNKEYNLIKRDNE